MAGKGFLAKRTEGIRLTKNIPNKAANIQPPIVRKVKPVTTGCAVKMSTHITVPKDAPTAKLLSKTIKLWIARMNTMVDGLAPVARRMANS